MIGDFFLQIITSIVGFMVNIFPVDLPFIPIATFRAVLLDAKFFIEETLYFFSPFINTQFLLLALQFMFFIIILFVFFGIVRFILNLIRGSGA